MVGKSRDNAQGAVEFALVMPIVILIVLGMLEMGRLIFVYASVLNASREAARYGAVTGFLPDGVTPQYKDCSGISVAANRLSFLATFKPIEINYDAGPADASPVGPCSNTITSAQWATISSGSHRIVVTVRADYSLMVPILPIPPFEMRSTSARTILGSVNIAPALSLSPESGPAAGGTVVTITGTNLTGSTVKFDGVTNTTCVVNSSTQITCTTPAHAAGSVIVTVITLGGPLTVTFIYYDVPVAPTLTSIAPNEGKTSSATPVIISGTNLLNALSVTFDGTNVIATCSGNTATQITCTPPNHPSSIPVDVNVIITTASGTSNSLIFTYLPEPIITSVFNPLTSTSTGAMTGLYPVTINGTNLTGGVVTFGGLACPVTASTATSITCTAPAWIGPAGPVDVIVTTPGGASNVKTFTYVASPVITSVLNYANNPATASGLTTGGYAVTVAGKYFSGGAVTFDGASTPCLLLSDIEFTCNIPTYSPGRVAGTVNVSVTTAYGTSNTMTFTYLPPTPTITITSPIPAKGLTTGGTSVTITGTNLTYTTLSGTSVASVTFDGATCIVSSAVLINCVTNSVPVHAVGSVDVYVVTPGGQSNIASFAYYAPAPTITSIVPNQGYTTGISIVTINGTFLSGNPTVTFGGVPTVAPCVIISDLQITCIAPVNAAGVVSVIITTTPAGGSFTKTGFTYVNPPPTISNLSPLVGKLAGGDTLTIDGTGLTGGTATFTGLLATGCSVVSDTKITCKTPSQATSGIVSGTVKVTTSNGTSPVYSFNFNYYGTMTITSISPVSGSVAGGTSVVLTGTGNLAGSTVTFGGAACTVTASTATTITCSTPARASTGSVDVVVTNPLGVSITKTNYYKYTRVPNLISVSPSSGLAGISITLTGTNLLDVTAVTLVSNKTASCTITVKTDTQIICTTQAQPGGAQNLVDITVTAPDGTSTLTNAFTYK